MEEATYRKSLVVQSLRPHSRRSACWSPAEDSVVDHAASKGDSLIGKLIFSRNYSTYDYTAFYPTMHLGLSSRCNGLNLNVNSVRQFGCLDAGPWRLRVRQKLEGIDSMINGGW